MEITALDLRGREVIPALAEIYPQLCLTPGEEGAALYKDIVLSGAEPPGRSLSHFAGSDGDSCRSESTPAGSVAVITLCRRSDFELFLQIMACRCLPTPIPRTQGAATLDGVNNWTRIRAHKEEFLRTAGPDADWDAEFRRFTADRNNFKDVMIVLSVGPYSAVPAEKLGLSEPDWLAASQVIRRTHECVHFLCRRLFPERIDPVFDELVADTAGLYAAFGRFDPATAELFLGASASGYTGGRLENYVQGPDKRRERLDELAAQVSRMLRRFEEISAPRVGIGPYELAIRLEEEWECWKQH